MTTGTQRDLLKRLFGKGPSAPPPMPRQAVEHDSVDKMQYRLHTIDSPRFRRLAIEDAPHIAPDIPEPDPIDFTSATPEEIAAWQAGARAAKAAQEDAAPYGAWENLTRDAFYSFHHNDDVRVADPESVDPATSHHAKIMRKVVSMEEHADARNITRDDPSAAAMATMGFLGELQNSLTEELVEQARQSEAFESARNQAENANAQLESMRDTARELKEQGQPIPRELVDKIKQGVIDKRASQDLAVQIAEASPVPFDMAAADAIENAVKAGLEAAENAKAIPSFGQGFGKGEPIYESPEQALTIADMWANNAVLNAIAKLYGRLDLDMQFKRAKRVVGGAEEIVDLKFGDELRHVVPSELALLGDPVYEDDFYMRYVNAELLIYETVGEENAGKGPIILCCDESYSMHGERNIWSKALMCCLLHIARREKRDFAYIGWADADEVNVHLFYGKSPLDPQAIVDAASHFYGGGTAPLTGITAAQKVMQNAAPFRKADIVMVSDGEAGFGAEDKRVRDLLVESGVRLWGVGVGDQVRKDTGYLNKLTDDVVHIHDFELDDPSAATAHLATHIA